MTLCSSWCRTLCHFNANMSKVWKQNKLHTTIFLCFITACWREKNTLLLTKAFRFPYVKKSPSISYLFWIVVSVIWVQFLGLSAGVWFRHCHISFIVVKVSPARNSVIALCTRLVNRYQHYFSIIKCLSQAKIHG